MCYVSWDIVNCCIAIQYWTPCNKWITLMVTQGHRSCHYSIGHISLHVICSNNLSILHRFWDITTFTVYVAACDLEMSSSFNNTVPVLLKLQATCYVCRGMGVTNVSNSKSDLQGHSRSLLFTAIRHQSSIVTTSLSCTVFEILSVISQNKEVTWPWTRCFKQGFLQP